MATTRISKIDALEDYFVFRASLDSLGIWAVSDGIAEELSLRNRPEVVRELTIKMISDCMERELVRLGVPTPEGTFETWPYETGEVIARIQRAWDRLEVPLPDLGDIVWLEATEKGVKHAEGYSPQESGLKLEQSE